MYVESCQISIMEFFARRINGFLPLAIFAKSFIVDVWQGPRYASDLILAKCLR